MDTSPKISFIIPAYNCAETITESVESIYNGNFEKGDEIIIINDASTDDTLVIAQNLQKRFPSIHVISHPANKGSAAAGRNTGIEHSHNDLIFCLDADNVLVADSIGRLKEYLLKQHADVATFGELHYFISTIGKVTHKWIYKEGEIGLQDALAGLYWPGLSGNYLFTKKSWQKAGRYDETIYGAHDSWAFGIKQLATGSKMVTMKNSFYYHRYGYESTYVRDQYKLSASVIGLLTLENFFDQIEEEDVEYMMSKEHRATWVDDLDKRPIRLKLGKRGVTGFLSQNYFFALKNKCKELLKKIIPSFLLRRLKNQH